MSFDIFMSKVGYDFNTAIKRHMSVTSKLKSAVGDSPVITRKRIDPSVRRPFMIPARNLPSSTSLSSGVKQSFQSKTGSSDEDEAEKAKRRLKRTMKYGLAHAVIAAGHARALHNLDPDKRWRHLDRTSASFPYIAAHGALGIAHKLQNLHEDWKDLGKPRKRKRGN